MIPPALADFVHSFNCLPQALWLQKGMGFTLSLSRLASRLGLCLLPQEWPLEFTRPSRLVCSLLFALIASKRRGRVAKSADCGLCSHKQNRNEKERGEKERERERKQARTKRSPPWIFRIPHTPCVPGRTQTGYSYRQLVSLHSKYSYCSAKLQINTLIESQGIRKYLACINCA